MKDNRLNVTNYIFLKLITSICIVAISCTGMLVIASSYSEYATTSSVNVFGSDYGDDVFEGICPSSDGTLMAYGSASGIGDRGDLLGIRKGTHDDFDGMIVKYSEDNTVIWKKCYGGTGQDYFNDAILTSDGDYILVGSTGSVDLDLDGIRRHESTIPDALIVKYDANGNLIWANTFGGTITDVFNSITQTTDGSIIVVGYSNSSTLDMVGNHKGSGDAIIVKYDSDGNLIWVKSLGGTQRDMFRKVISDGNGGFVAVGNSFSEDGDFSPRHGPGIDDDAIMARYDANGNMLWLNVFGGISVDNFYDVCQSSDGGFVAVGYTGSRDYDMVGNTMTGYNGFATKFDSSGNLVWNKFIGGSRQDYLYGICLLDDDGFAVVGCTLSNDYDYEGLRKQTLGNAYEAGIVKLNSDGSTVWSKTFGGINGRGIQEDRFFGVVQLENGQVVATGHTASEDGDLEGLRDPSSYNNKDAVFVNYTLQPYIVTFIYESEVYDKQKVFEGEAVGNTNWPDDPDITGYNFNGWYTERNGLGEQYTADTLINSNTILYAYLTPKTYSVTFDANGGMGTMNNQDILFETSAMLNANAFTFEGYTFAGWNTVADPSVIPDGTAYADGESFTMYTEGITLYAQWDEINVDGLELDVKNIVWDLGTTDDIAYTITPDDALDTTVTSASDNTRVATVISNDGYITVTTHDVGIAHITVTANDTANGVYTDTIKLHVINPAPNNNGAFHGRFKGLYSGNGVGLANRNIRLYSTPILSITNAGGEFDFGYVSYDHHTLIISNENDVELSRISVTLVQGSSNEYTYDSAANLAVITYAPNTGNIILHLVANDSEDDVDIIGIDFERIVNPMTKDKSVRMWILYAVLALVGVMSAGLFIWRKRMNTKFSK